MHRDYIVLLCNSQGVPCASKGRIHKEVGWASTGLSTN